MAYYYQEHFQRIFHLCLAFTLFSTLIVVVIAAINKQLTSRWSAQQVRLLEHLLTLQQSQCSVGLFTSKNAELPFPKRDKEGLTFHSS